MEKVVGKVGRVLSVINTRETTAKIKSMVMVFLLGLVGISTKASIKKMSETAMAR